MHISKNTQRYLLNIWHKKLDMQTNTFHSENIPKISLEKCENERWTQLTRGFASLLTFDWIIDHNFQNTAQNFTFFIPLDSYRKIDEPSVDEKIYFVSKWYSFKENICTKISPIASILTFDWIIDHNFQNTTRNFTFFIPLDSYWKIEEANMDEKIYFVAKWYSFKENICTKISPIASDLWLNNWS